MEKNPKFKNVIFLDCKANKDQCYSSSRASERFPHELLYRTPNEPERTDMAVY